MLRWLKKKFLTILGDIQFVGFWHPFWIVVGPVSHKVKGAEYAKIIELIHNDAFRDGDIVLRSYDHYIDSWLIPGSLTHSGIYVGLLEGVPMVVHAIAEGVLLETLYDFIRTDHFAVVRPQGLTEDESASAAAKALKFVGHPYDFDFKYSNDAALYCNEMTGRSHEHLKKKFKFKMNIVGFGPLKRKCLFADGIFLSDVEIIFMTESIKRMKVWDEFMTLFHNKTDDAPRHK